MLERTSDWIKASFFVAAGLMAVFAILLATYAITGNSTALMARNFFGPAGFVMAFIGTLALKSNLHGRPSWLSRAATGLTALGIVGGTVVAVMTLANLTGIIDSRPSWVEGLSALIMFGMIGVALVGFIFLKADVATTTLGLLLLAPAVIFAVNFARGIILGRWIPIWAPALLASAQTIAILAIGSRLPSDQPGSKQESPQPATA